MTAAWHLQREAVHALESCSGILLTRYIAILSLYDMLLVLRFWKY